MIKYFIVSLLFLTTSLQADVVFKNKSTDHSIRVTEISTLSTSTNPSLGFITGGTFETREFTNTSLERSGISKKDFVDFLLDGEKDSTRVYTFIYKRNQYNRNNLDLIEIQIRRKFN